MNLYADPTSGGFFHQLAPDKHVAGEPSKASTATCASFLIHSGRWEQDDFSWTGKEAELLKTLATGAWTSAGLEEGNPFTVSFLLESLLDLFKVCDSPGSDGHKEDAPTDSNDSRDLLAPPSGTAPALDWVKYVRSVLEAGTPAVALLPAISKTENVAEEAANSKPPLPVDGAIDEWLRYLDDLLVASHGGLFIDEFPATAFLTYKAVRVLKRWGRLSAKAEESAHAFAWSRLYEESVGISSETPEADPFELAYAVLTASTTTKLQQMTLGQRNALRHALDQFFDAQNDVGAWGRSRALFRYPKLGNAYCYDYELLVQMMSEPQVTPLLVGKHAALAKAFHGLEQNAIPIGTKGEVGWASGHLYGRFPAPESWTTASAFHFCHEFRRFIVDAIRREVFAYARAPMDVRHPANPVGGKVTIDRKKFLDCKVDVGHDSLTEILEHQFLTPIVSALEQVERGHGFGRDVPNSAILYGPPGTSKTKLAELVAESLGWPLLKLDPSHLTKDGFDRLHAETNLLFTMLASAERVVVLLDEFDELVQDRDQSGAESSSRFMTTAMLPKIAELAERRRIVYLLATNHIERFDDAISRAGRFDLVIPVMPPTLEAKLSKWVDLAAMIKKFFSDGLDADLEGTLEDLTFLEFSQFAAEAKEQTSRKAFSALVRKYEQSATLLKQQDSETGEEPSLTWKERILKEAGRNRLKHG